MTPTRRHPRAPLAAAALVPLALLAASPAAAQTCLGFAGFGGQPLRLGGSIGSGNDATAFGVDLAFGRAAGAFGNVGAGVVNVDEVDESATQLGASIGYQIPVGTGRGASGAQVCPVGGFSYTIGPNFTQRGVDVESNILQLTGGFALGVPVLLTPGVRLVPYGSLALAHQRLSLDIGAVEQNDSETFGLFEVGGGFVFGGRFTVRPSVTLPVGLDDSDPVFGIGVGINFGGNPR